MPRKITTDDKKNKLDLLMMKIEQNKADMKATYDAYDKIMSELKKEEDERVSEFKDLAYEFIVQYFGEHISTEEFKEWIMVKCQTNRNTNYENVAFTLTHENGTLSFAIPQFS